MHYFTGSRQAAFGVQQASMLLTVSATADYDLPAETFLLLMVEPSLTGEHHQVVRESLRTTPTPFSDLATDIYGNTLRRLIAPSGLFSFDFSATIETAPNAPLLDDAMEHVPKDIPVGVLPYMLPSRYCPSDKLARFARSEFSNLPPGGARVRAIADWIRNRTEYQYGTSDATTAADDTILQCVGVCRDFAHLLVALCRACGIPARYVSGYCLGLEPPDFHAWAQVWLSGAWHNVDATFNGVRPALVPIATGRDAADVSLLTLSGDNTFRAQSVSVERIS